MKRSIKSSNSKYLLAKVPTRTLEIVFAECRYEDRYIRYDYDIMTIKERVIIFTCSFFVSIGKTILN